MLARDLLLKLGLRISFRLEWILSMGAIPTVSLPVYFRSSLWKVPASFGRCFPQCLNLEWEEQTATLGLMVGESRLLVFLERPNFRHEVGLVTLSKLNCGQEYSENLTFQMRMDVHHFLTHVSDD